MKFFLSVTCLLALAYVANVHCRPAGDESAEVIVNEIESDGEGGYTLRLELSNGIKETETARLEEVDTVDEDGKPTRRKVLVREGESTYTDPETGDELTVKWTADQNGYQAEGDHLPKPPSSSEEDK